MGTTDFEVWRGNAYRAIGWNFPFDLTGSAIVLTIKWRNWSLIKSTADGGLVTENTEVEGATVPVVYWTPTLEETRQIPLGRVADYEVERRVPGGEERTYVKGKVIGMGGKNND